MLYAFAQILGAFLLLLGIKNSIGPVLSLAQAFNGIVVGGLLLIGGSIGEFWPFVGCVIAGAVFFKFNKPPFFEVALARKYISSVVFNQSGTGPKLRTSQIPNFNRAWLESNFAKMASSVELIEEMAIQTGLEVFLEYRDCLISEFVTMLEKQVSVPEARLRELMEARGKIYSSCQDAGTYLSKELSQGRVLSALSREPTLEVNALAGIEMPSSVNDLHADFPNVDWEVVMEEGKQLGLDFLQWKSWANQLLLLDLEMLATFLRANEAGQKS